MEDLTSRQERVLEVLDEQIDLLDKKLKKVQPLIDELSKLRKTRATLLNERGPTGGVRGNTLTMESVIHAFNKLGGEATAPQIADIVGSTDTTVRSHLNRHKGSRYEQTDERGVWRLIGNEEEEE
jgi:response regulator of citrate/malate metabolism